MHAQHFQYRLQCEFYQSQEVSPLKKREMLHYPPAVPFIEPGKTIHHWLAQWLPEFLYMLASSLPMAGTRVSNMTCMCEDKHKGRQTVLRKTK